ncbi:hypothetical protein EJ05DRAFT_16639 [Pseudovirgaria hyperparasitica]|uniref:SnoaL-like domain-containing protein n=1 Tax=Pseudovirgaria hyperparasitica TaxID=470096 RepID=A0A6A6WKU2_9PEZI|nr:uncharacterized protein EJ05DRAFT_16639 [Pseudovirgaria hyperparasitica]KAF2762824.1 hypothetical protein EJ05DRAFT_16639 [Pseudovirgaria hyperparasitica]
MFVSTPPPESNALPFPPPLESNTLPFTPLSEHPILDSPAPSDQAMLTPQSPVSRHTLEALLTRFVAGWNTWTVPAIISLRTPTCTHTVLPRSIGTRPMDNAQYGRYLTRLKSVFADFTLELESFVIDPSARSFMLYGRGIAHTPIGTYRNEYACRVRASPDGSAVEEVVEFVDSKVTEEFFGRLGRFRKAARL